jgi:hypothetical protein
LFVKFESPFINNLLSKEGKVVYTNDVARYEVINIQVRPANIELFTSIFPLFGWEKIREDEYKALKLNPEEEEKEVVAPHETVRGNQTIYPESGLFHDYGTEHLKGLPPKDDPGLLAMYFKRKVDLPNRDELQALYERWSDLKIEEESRQLQLEHKQLVSHFLFMMGEIPSLLGFFVLMTGITFAILGKVQEKTDYWQIGLVCLIAGGIFLLGGFALFVVSMVKGGTRPQQNKEARAIQDLQKQEAQILQKASSIIKKSPQNPFTFKIVDGTKKN